MSEVTKVRETGRIVSQEQLASGVFSMWVGTNAAEYAIPGQFVSLYTPDQRHILPRPISICEVERNAHALRLVYRVAGEGTKEFSQMKPGDEIELLGPLGNGYPLRSGSALLIGGGIGVPPLLELAKELSGRNRREAGDAPAEKITVVLGYRDAETFLKEDFEQFAEVYIATDDGSVGTHGTVIDAIRENHLTADTIYSCGPTPMLRGVKAFSEETGIKTYLSLEERMACGVGACLGCVCKSKDIDDHSKVKNKRVCADGPVFLAEEVEL